MQEGAERTKRNFRGRFYTRMILYNDETRNDSGLYVIRKWTTAIDDAIDESCCEQTI